MRGRQSRSAGGEGETHLQQPHCLDPQDPGWCHHECHWWKPAPVSTVAGYGVLTGLDFYCGLLVVVGLGQLPAP